MSTLIPVREAQSTLLGKPRRRWVKVDIDEKVFDTLHLMAAESRMRIQPYLCRFLAEAWPYSECSDNPAALSFSSGLTSAE
jgi:hypothetical protein